MLLDFGNFQKLELVQLEILNNMTRTKGDVIVEEIKIGDIHYEFEYGFCIKSEVTSLPVRNESGLWEWTSKTESGGIINYAISEGFSHYGPNLYTYEAYSGCKQV